MRAGPPGEAPKRTPTPLGELGERALGLSHIVTGIWLLYLTCGVTLNSAAGLGLPV